MKELSVAEGNKYLQVADCVLSTVNLIGSYFHHSVDLVDTYTPYKVGCNITHKPEKIAVDHDYIEKSKVVRIRSHLRHRLSPLT